MWGLSLILAGAAAGGCSHAGRQTSPAHLFRDESEPSDGFQYTESAAPAGEASAKSGGGEASDTTIEVEVDDESADSAEGVADEAAEAESEAGDDESAEDEGEEEEEGEESAQGSPHGSPHRP